MKRSEMINIINNILQKNLDSQNNYYSDAVDILEAIEKAGMLPPEVIGGHEDWCHHYDGDDCNCNGYKSHIWEPEE